jgi:hypothetical protein
MTLFWNNDGAPIGGYLVTVPDTPPVDLTWTSQGLTVLLTQTKAYTNYQQVEKLTGTVQGYGFAYLFYFNSTALSTKWNVY